LGREGGHGHFPWGEVRPPSRELRPKRDAGVGKFIYIAAPFGIDEGSRLEISNMKNLRCLRKQHRAWSRTGGKNIIYQVLNKKVVWLREKEKRQLDGAQFEGSKNPLSFTGGGEKRSVRTPCIGLFQKTENSYYCGPTIKGQGEEPLTNSPRIVSPLSVPPAPGQYFSWGFSGSLSKG